MAWIWSFLSRPLNSKISLLPFFLNAQKTKTHKTRFQMLSLNPCICGTFPRQEDGDELRKLRRNSSKKRQNKNPYSLRGLDKFSALVADLQEKRQKIYSQLGSDDLYFIQFAFSNTNDVKPIVVKLKDKEKGTTSSETSDNELQETKKTENVVAKKSKKTVVVLQRYYHLFAVLVMILLFLAVFGRSVAIVCTSIGWYVIPTLKERASNVRKLKKKQYGRRLSQNTTVTDGLSSPKKSKNMAALND